MSELVDQSVVTLGNVAIPCAVCVVTCFISVVLPQSANLHCLHLLSPYLS